MTPEQHLAHLRNSDAWTIAPLASRINRRVRPERGLLFQLATTLAAGGVVAALVVGGIAVLQNQDFAPAIPTPTPTDQAPEPKPSTTVKPEQLFDGDCSAVLNEQKASAIAGMPLKVRESSFVVDPSWGGYSFAVAQSGGIDCRWAAPPQEDVSFSPTISLVFLYDKLLPPLEKPQSCGQGYTENITCAIDGVANGVRYSGGIGGERADAEKIADEVVAAIEEFLQSESIAPAPLPAAGAWSTPPDCDRLGTLAEINTLLDGTFATYGGEGHGNRGSQAVWNLLTEDQSLNCYWFDESDNSAVQVGVFGGGAWAQPIVANEPVAEPVSIDGFDSAYLATDEYGSSTLHAFRGDNWIQIPADVATLDDRKALLIAFANALDAMN